MNKTEVKAMYLLQSKKMTVLELANALSKSVSWTSECIHHLEKMGFVKTEKMKNYVYVSLTMNAMGQSLIVLMKEEPMLNLESMFTRSGLIVLPLLLTPGCSAKELVDRSKLSKRTVKGLLPRWKRMGVVLQEEGKYLINPRYKLLTNFLRKFSEHKNAYILNNIYPQGVIVWQWRDEFIFSLDQKIDDPRFIPAGITKLDEYNFNLVHVNEYFLHDPCTKIVTKEEAMVQAFHIDQKNPRISRLFNIYNHDLNYKKLFEYANKYGVKTKIKGIMKADD